MKEKLLIVGAGGFGRVTLEHAIKDFDCSFVDDGKSIGEEINGVKVVGGVSDLPSLFMEYKKLVLSIGNNNIREKISHAIENKYVVYFYVLSFSIWLVVRNVLSI